MKYCSPEKAANIKSQTLSKCFFRPNTHQKHCKRPGVHILTHKIRQNIMDHPDIKVFLIQRYARYVDFVHKNKIDFSRSIGIQIKHSARTVKRPIRCFFCVFFSTFNAMCVSDADFYVVRRTHTIERMQTGIFDIFQ